MNRRDFIRNSFFGTAAVAGAASMAPSASAAAPKAQLSPTQTQDVDIVVVGAGAAGMWAALTAFEAGASVAILEKEPTVLLSGCALCGGAVLGSNTKMQAEQGIEDSAEAHFLDHMRISRSTADPVLSRAFCEESGQVVDWLIDHGVVFSHLDPFFLNAETTVPRAHWTEEGSGKPFAEALEAALTEAGVEIQFNTSAKQLVVDGTGVVSGVIAEDAEGTVIQFNAKSVILCTGGFPNNDALLTKSGFAHEDGIPGATGATGDGYLMAESLGVVAQDMEWGMTYYFIKKGVLGGYVLPMYVMVNAEGKRFVGEHSGYMMVIPRVQDQPDGVVYAILDAGIAEVVGFGEEAISEGMATGILKTACTIEALAQAILVDPKGLKATVKDYNAYAVAGLDEDYGKPAEMLIPLAKPPFNAARVWLPKPTLTYGGMKINEKAQILNDKGEPIPGLYGAGDDVCGLLGRYYPGSGTAIGTAMVFGRIAGRNAAADMA